MFWIWAENSVDNTEMFSLLLSSAYTEARPFLLLTPPHQRLGWGYTRSWEATQLGQRTPTDQRDIPYHMTSCSAYRAGGRRRKGGDIWSDGICLPKSPLRVTEPCFPGDGWAPACRWEVVNEFLVLLCLRAQLFLYLLNCLYLSPRVFSLLLFRFSPPSQQGGMSEWVCGA